MSLDVRPQNLYDEIRHQEEFRDRHLGKEYEDVINRFVGPGYHYSHLVSGTDMENHSYEWISLFLPSMVSGHPRIKASTPRLGYAQAIARAVQLGVNRNFQLTNFRVFLEKCAVDFAFRWCVGLTLPHQVPGFIEAEDPNFRPVSRRLSPRDYGHDFAALEETEVRFRFHTIRRDKEDILEEAKAPHSGWNRTAVAAMPADSRERDSNYGRDRKREIRSLRRDEVEFREIWIPEIELDTYTTEEGKKIRPRPEDGYNGTIFTLAMSGTHGSSSSAPTDFLRKPRPFYGPQEGPYTFGGYLPVPDETIPLSPISAVQAQAQSLNSMRQALQKALESYKKGLAIDSSIAGNVAEVLRDFEDTGVFAVENIENLREKVMEITVQGMDQTHLAQYQLLRQALDRASGMSEALRGFAGGGGTATAEDIAAQSSNRRHGFMTQKFLEFAAGCAKKEAWYLFHDPRSHIELGEESAGLFIDPSSGEPTEIPIVMRGGGDTSYWDSLDIQIEPISMRHTSEAMEEIKSQKLDALLATVIPMIPQFPYWDWETYLAMKGEELGIPALPKMVDFQQAKQLGTLMLGAQLMEGPRTQAPEHRLGVDLPDRMMRPGFASKASKGGGISPQAILQGSGVTGGRSQVTKPLIPQNGAV